MKLDPCDDYENEFCDLLNDVADIVSITADEKIVSNDPSYLTELVPWKFNRSRVVQGALFRLWGWLALF